MIRSIRDALLKLTRALPSGAATVTSASMDTGKTTTAGDQLISADWLLTLPALNTTQLPDTQTLTRNIIMSDNADMSSPTSLYPGFLVQTGAGGAGAAASSGRFSIPSNAKRYIGFTAVKSGSGDASAASDTLEMLF